MIVAPQGLGDLIMILPVLRILIACGISYDILLKNKAMGNALIGFGFRPNAIFYSNTGLITIILQFFKLRMSIYRYVLPSATVNTKKFLLFYFLACFNIFNIFNIFLYFRVKDLSIHIVKRNLILLAVMKITSLGVVLRSSNYSFKLNNLRRFEKNYVVIAPGSGTLETHKRWPVQNFSNLCLKILENYPQISVKILGAVDEEILCRSIFNNLVSTGLVNSSRVELITALSNINDVVDIYSNALLAIVNCNGGSHIAGMTGVPIIGLYGPTNPQITGPFNKNLHIMKSSLKCSPCYSQKNPYGCAKPVCMESILVDEVWNVVIRLLGVNTSSKMLAT